LESAADHRSQPRHPPGSRAGACTCRYDVASNYRSHREQAEVAAAEVRTIGRGSAAFPADVSRGADGQSLARTSGAEFGQIDILVNNAGIARVQKVEDITEVDWTFSSASILLLVF
jgi:3-oxoacyl-[acyl-carrier protein] reductase